MIKNTAYQNAQTIRRIIVNRTAEIMNYSWDDGFNTKRIKSIYEDCKEKIPTINVAELTAEQMDELGFSKWNEGSQMRLIPLWLYKWLPEVIETECINGTKSILKKSEIDTDNRGGCLAYGIYPAKS